MTKRGQPHKEWDATWEGARRRRLESTLSATPAQRLAWLEEALELAQEAKTRRPRTS
jgi:hypothetical protein